MSDFGGGLLAEKLGQALRERNAKQSQHRAVGVVHPSAIAKCQRMIGYHLLNTEQRPQQVADTALLRFEIGHAVHRLLQSIFSDLPGCVFADEVEVKNDVYHIKGSADGVLSWRVSPTAPRRKAVVEYKTANNESYEKMVHGGKIPFPYLAQAHTYAKLLNIQTILFVLLNKSNEDLEIVEMEFQAGIWAWVEERLQAIHFQLRKKDSPLLPGERSKYGCLQCPFSYICPDAQH